MSRAAVRLAVGVAAIAGAIALTGCSDSAGGYDAGISGCYPPLACGPMYPVAYYPYVVHPYAGYIHDPAHTSITVVNNRPQAVYRPYSAPVTPGFRPAPANQAQQAPKPAAPAPKAPAPAPRPVVKAGK